MLRTQFCPTCVRRAYGMAGPTYSHTTPVGITQGICELKLPAGIPWGEISRHAMPIIRRNNGLELRHCYTTSVLPRISEVQGSKLGSDTSCPYISVAPICLCTHNPGT